jgi:hypothetical protein
MGLDRLGHDVYYFEDSDEYPSCYDPSRDTTDTDPTYGLAFTKDSFDRVGLGDRWGYYDWHTSSWHGPCFESVGRICETADLLINLGELNPIRTWFEDIPVKVLIDHNPVFGQIDHLTNPAAHDLAARHDYFFTFAENFGCADCTVPDDGFAWRPTRQPIVLDSWPVTEGRSHGSFTTLMQWDSYPSREYAGSFYGMKSLSFEPYLELPRRTSAKLQMAVGSPGAPRSELRNAGWNVLDPLGPSRDLWEYQKYVRESKAEFTVAKHGYVVTNSGWFSDRSASFLASGRPVVVQETGFSAWLDAGEGVLSFKNPEEALACIEDVERRYEQHCRSARQIAEQFFDSDDVLTRILEAVTNRSLISNEG